MNQNRPKYIAEGYIQDLIELMTDFLKLKSFEFPDFASVWRKHHFSLIFMGRPDDVETTEFVNEIFRLTTQYLEEDTFIEHVGAVYILYALYLNQISYPTVKIRLEMKHFDVIKSMYKVSVENNYKTLQFVLQYLIDNAFQYVENQTLRGPLIVGLPSVHDVSICKMKAVYKETFNDYCGSNNLRRIRDLHKQYVEEKNKAAGCASTVNSETNKIYDEVLEGWEAFVEREKEIERNSGVGRAKPTLKKQAFQKQSRNKSDTIEEKLASLTSDTVINITKPWQKIKEEKRQVRPRKEEKRPGRPPKNPKPATPPPEQVSDDEYDISHLIEQQKDLFLPPVCGEYKKNRTKRDPYYKSSPKREDDDIFNYSSEDE